MLAARGHLLASLLAPAVAQLAWTTPLGDDAAAASPDAGSTTSPPPPPPPSCSQWSTLHTMQNGI